jgi:predicted RNA-binding protein with PUA-like domain
MRPGDAVFFYHTGQERSIVATASVALPARDQPSSADRAPVEAVPELKFDAWLPRPVSLAEVKADGAFGDFDLVRLSRLSVMPVSADHWERIMKLAGRGATNTSRGPA